MKEKRAENDRPIVHGQTMHGILMEIPLEPMNGRGGGKHLSDYPGDESS